MLIFVSMAVVPLAPAQDGSPTRAQGYFNVVIPGAEAVGTPKVSMVSLPLYPRPLPTAEGGPTGAMAGLIDSVTGDTMTDTDAGWLAGELSTEAAPYYVRFTSGTLAGRMMQITANTTDTLTLETDGDALTGSVTVGTDGYEIVAGHTLISAFGTGVADINTPGVLGGADGSGDGADVIQINDGLGWSSYVYNVTSDRWELRGSLRPFSRNNIPISPESCLIYNRAGLSDFTLVTTGHVPDQGVQILVATGVNMIAANFPTDRELRELKLEEMPGWRPIGGPNNYTEAEADYVTIRDAVGWLSYVYDADNSRWQRLGSLRPFDRGDTPIPAGTGLMILKRGSADDASIFLDPLPSYYQIATSQ